MLPPVADTSDLDGKTAAEVLDLETKKRQAVVREDYDEAKQLKNKVERLRSFGQRIAELENRCDGPATPAWFSCNKVAQHNTLSLIGICLLCYRSESTF